MTLLSEFLTSAQAVAGHAALDVEPDGLLDSLRGLDDAAVVELVGAVSALVGCAERITVVGAAVIAERSARAHGGLAGERGHRSPVALIQEITGGTRGDAVRTVRVGTSLLEEAGAAGVGAAGVGAAGVGAAGVGAAGVGAAGVGAAGVGAAGVDAAAPPALVWHDCLRSAMLRGALSGAQHDAIRRGLGEPPRSSGDAPGGTGAHSADEIAQVWAIAASQLVDEARGCTVEELGARARAVRDALDPIGAEERFARRFAARSFRMWTDGDGAAHARIDFDHEMAAWVRSIIDAALRPRRGGPRFVSGDERAAAEELEQDSRSNDQLAYDLIMDVLRAGALADAGDVYGARRPGVRLVAVIDPATSTLGPRDAFGRLLATGHIEDGGAPVPGSILDRALCETGSVTVTVDGCGNPLDVGREQRLFTPRQRIALAIRDGGCLWPGCDRPPSYCEVHHGDHWHRDHGRTDIARGLLLCRFHHMLLHNNGWRITREADGPFLLHAPPGHPAGNAPIVLRSRSPLAWAWDPPPDRRHWREAPAFVATEAR